jgi:hypothetical protein
MTGLSHPFVLEVAPDALTVCRFLGRDDLWDVFPREYHERSTAKSDPWCTDSDYQVDPDWPLQPAPPTNLDSAWPPVYFF